MGNQYLDDLSSFLNTNDRLPCIGDDRPPWTYRGWLIPYIMAGHAAGHCGNRWDYHLRTVQAGRLLDEPIPKIHFGEPDKSFESKIRDWSQIIGWDCGGWSDLRKLIDWLAWALAVSDELPALDDAKHEKLYREVDLSSFLIHPYDYFGTYVSINRARSWNPLGFFPTPHQVCECMVNMTFHDYNQENQEESQEGNWFQQSLPGMTDDPGSKSVLVEKRQAACKLAGKPASKRDPRTLKVCDPCVGTGRMLLHASNYSMRLYGQDVDNMVLTICLINGALYAPWLSFPLAESFFS